MGRSRESNLLKYFVGGLFLSAGVLLLAFQTESFTLSGIISKLSNVPQSITLAGLCIITAAIIQSAIYPFHRWLLSAMTSPTPASALMHAGFKRFRILLALFSTVICLEYVNHPLYYRRFDGSYCSIH
jgi:NAD(P)H-quinone oxidoreductase subunit 5